MNPFQQHAANMAEYQTMLAEPVNNDVGDFVTYSGSKIVAVVGPFEVRQVLVAGGFTPRLMGQAIVQKSAVPSTVKFKTGQDLTVKQVGGSVRQCKIDSLEDDYLEWRINLWDIAERA